MKKRKMFWVSWQPVVLPRTDVSTNRLNFVKKDKYWEPKSQCHFVVTIIIIAVFIFTTISGVTSVMDLTTSFCLTFCLSTTYIVLGTALILGAFARLRKATVSFVMSVCLSLRPSVRMQQLGFHWTDFDET
jgi:hypothetical protein